MSDDTSGRISPTDEPGDLGLRSRPVARAVDQDMVDRQFAALVQRGMLDPEFDEVEIADAPAPAARWRLEDVDVSFADVVGLVPVKRRLQRLFATDRRDHRSGVLLYGPAGCGKSLLARAVAGELGAELVHVTVSDLIDPELRDSDLRNAETDLTALFDQARAAGPVVVLLDGIDALDPADRRGAAVAERLAAEIGALAGPDRVIVIASTDRPWAVHPLLRATAALTEAVFVPAPSGRDRRDLFRALLPQRTSPTLSMRRLARCTTGLTGADIAAICAHAGEEAALDAITGSPRLVKMADIAAANAQTPRTAADWSRRSLQARRAA